MKILSVNAGSSSLKIQLYEMPEGNVLASATFEKIGIQGSFYTIKINGEKIMKNADLNNHEEAVHIFLDELIAYNIIDKLDEIEGIGHRVVHGGSKYHKATVIDDQVMADIEEYSHLAPLHNPANLLGIRALKEVLPNVLNVAVFDTAFHQTLEEEAYIYPVPYTWYEQNGVRKYGFHGTSHQYVAQKVMKLLNNENLKIITCHLGSGGSLSAINNGVCIDTTMGFTPNAGIPMGTRCGDIDASIIEYMMKQTGKSITDIMNDLNKNSGLLGISGVSNDARDIAEGIKNGNKRCLLARKVYARRVVNYIAQYYVLLEGLDVLVFTAGIGENDPAIRKEIIDRLKLLGIIIDEEINNQTSRQDNNVLISTTDSKIKCYVIPTNEELMIANEVYTLSH